MSDIVVTYMDIGRCFAQVFVSQHGFDRFQRNVGIIHFRSKGVAQAVGGNMCFDLRGSGIFINTSVYGGVMHDLIVLSRKDELVIMEFFDIFG